MVNAISNMRDICKTSVCLVDELWVKEMFKNRHFLRILAKFDVVMLYYSQTVKPLSETIGQKPWPEWKSLWDGEEFVYDIVQKIPDLPRDPAVVANDYLMDLDYGDLIQGPVPRFPFHFNGQAVRSSRLAPGYGEHTWEVLTERLGKTSAELEDLTLRSIIA